MSDGGRARLILVSLLGTFVVVRLLLWRSPDSDFDIAGYNIHHLFTGVLLATAAALDEVVYLIATDGSNASYLLPVSFWGGAVVVGLAALWIALVGFGRRRGSGRAPGA
jgi:hypothetical protein